MRDEIRDAHTESVARMPSRYLGRKVIESTVLYIFGKKGEERGRDREVYYPIHEREGESLIVMHSHSSRRRHVLRNGRE